jgi:hypothetical protein
LVLGKQQKFQLELTDFSNSIQLDLTSSNIISMLKEYHQTIEEFRFKEQISDEKIHILEEQLFKLRTDEKAQRLKCNFLTKQMKKINSKTK